MVAGPRQKYPESIELARVIFIALLHAGWHVQPKKPPKTFWGSFGNVMHKEFVGTVHEHGGWMQHGAHLINNVLAPWVFPVWLKNRIALARRNARMARDLELHEQPFLEHSETHFINKVPGPLTVGLERSRFSNPHIDSYSNALKIVEEQAKASIGLQRMLAEEITKAQGARDAGLEAQLKARLEQVKGLEGLMNARRTLINAFSSLRTRWLKELRTEGHVSEELVGEEGQLRHEVEELAPVLQELQNQIAGIEEEFLKGYGK